MANAKVRQEDCSWGRGLDAPVPLTKGMIREGTRDTEWGAVSPQLSWVATPREWIWFTALTWKGQAITILFWADSPIGPAYRAIAATPAEVKASYRATGKLTPAGARVLFTRPVESTWKYSYLQILSDLKSLG